tara:strand:+ start:678 stop:986 length:309 start_codon:yes stop_codon:yes gene_type:complete
MSKLYRPLPKYLTISNSKIEGLGLFAKEDIEKDTMIGITHLLFLDNITKDNWIRTPLGGFYNYSKTPNCYSLDKEYYKVLYAKDKILAGEELTCDYDLYKPE